jgi:hypothetical protein
MPTSFYIIACVFILIGIIVTIFADKIFGGYVPKEQKCIDYRLQRIKIHHIVCEVCCKALIDNDVVISFIDNENKMHTSHATCCFIVDEENQIATNYHGEQVPKEDLPKYGVMINAQDKIKIEEFIK